MMYMFKRFITPNRLLCGFIPGLDSVYDSAEKYEEPQTGLERVHALFKPDKFGELRKEVGSAVQFTWINSAMTGFYGGIKYSKHAFETFVTQHEATRFVSAYEAKRRMHDYIALEFAKNFFIYALKGGVFAGLFMFTVITVEAYRDKQGILEFVAGGVLAGGLCRMNNGIAGMISGSSVGLSLGLVIGIILFVFHKLTGASLMDDVRTLQAKMRERRNETIAKAIEKLKAEDSTNAAYDNYRLKLLDRTQKNEGKVLILLPDNESENNAPQSTSNLSKAANDASKLDENS